MIGPSNRNWIVLSLAGLILSFGHVDAQQEPQKAAPNPYLMGTEGYEKGPRGLTSYQPIAIDQPPRRQPSKCAGRRCCSARAHARAATLRPITPTI